MGGDLAPAQVVIAPGLFADRFLVEGPNEAIDLATGHRVWLRLISPAGRPALERWFARCAAIADLSHPHVVALADFGEAGRAGYFEAWGCHPPPFRRWRGRDAATDLALDSAARYLTSHGMSVGGVRWGRVIDRGGRPAVRLDEEPQAWAGDDPPRGLAVFAAAPRHGAEVHGTDLVARLSDVLDAGVAGRPRSLRFSLPRGAEEGAVVHALARCSRLRGYVPLCAAVVTGVARGTACEAWRQAVEGRHVLVLQPAGPAESRRDAAMFFLSLGLSSDRPHVLLNLDSADTGRQPFAQALPVAARPLRLREEAVPYASDLIASTWSPVVLARGGAPDHRVRTFIAAAAAGRHAQAERWLRETEGRCARRQENGGAGEAALLLGRLMLMRGRLTEAQRSLDGARAHFERARLWPRAVATGVFCGLLATDGGRFVEAESALRAAALAAAELRDESTQAFATLALARCLLWQERPDEALDGLRAVSAADSPSAGGEEAQIDEWRRLGTASCARERPYGVVPGEPLANL
jgi:hypothetical protein